MTIYIKASGEYHRPLSFPDGIETPEPREQDTGGRGEQRLLICASGEGGSGGQGSGENRGGVGAGGCAHAGCASCGGYSCGRGATDHREASGCGGRNGNSIEIRAASHESGPRTSCSALHREEAHRADGCDHRSVHYSQRPHDQPGYCREDNSRSVHAHGSAEAVDVSVGARACGTSQSREVVDRGRSRPADLGTILDSGLSLVADTGAGLVHTGAGFIHKGAEIVRETTDLAVNTGAEIVRDGVGLLHNAADVVTGRDEHRHRCADCPHCGAGTVRISNGSELMCGTAGVNQIVGAGVIGLASRGDLVHGVDFPYSGTGVVTIPGGTELVYRTAGVNRVTGAEVVHTRTDGDCGGQLTHRDYPPAYEGRRLVNFFRRAFRGFWMFIREVTRT